MVLAALAATAMIKEVARYLNVQPRFVDSLLLSLETHKYVNYYCKYYEYPCDPFCRERESGITGFSFILCKI